MTKRLPERQPLWFLPFFCEQGSAICPGKVTVFERVHSRAQLFGQPLGKIGAVAQTAGQDDLRQKPLAQLAALFDPPISKSCLNHRIRKIMEEARKLS